MAQKLTRLTDQSARDQRSTSQDGRDGVVQSCDACTYCARKCATMALLQHLAPGSIAADLVERCLARHQLMGMAFLGNATEQIADYSPTNGPSCQASAKERQGAWHSSAVHLCVASLMIMCC